MNHQYKPSTHTTLGFTIQSNCLIRDWRHFWGLLAVMVAPNLFNKRPMARAMMRTVTDPAIGSALATHRLDGWAVIPRRAGRALWRNTTVRSTWDGPIFNKDAPKDPWATNYQYSSNAALTR